MPRPSLLSRPLGLLTLVALATGSIVEPVLGTLRDGAVHHETAAAADAHRQTGPAGDHGHEDGVSHTSDHRHGRQHEHGTGTDHCTHVHGIGLPVVTESLFQLPASPLSIEQPIPHQSASHETLSPPPKA